MSTYTGPTPQEDVKKAREGAPRWMWTFADMMTLLFALFVLILTFADFDPLKFNRTANHVRATFHEPPGDSIALTKNRDADNISPQSSLGIDLRQLGQGKSDLDDLDEQELARERERQRLKDYIRDALFQRLSLDIGRGRVFLEETDQGVLLRFPSSTAFGSGSADLTQEIGPALDRAAEVMAGVQGQIEVSGHTDNVPIATGRFRSNWDLSTARAVSVVHYLLGAGIEQSRVSATGYADSRPLAANDTPQNRATNRRVEIEMVVGGDLDTFRR